MLVVGIFIRFRIPETPLFEAAKKEKQIVKVPIKELFADHKVSLLLSTFIVASSGTIYYVGVALIPTLFHIYFHVIDANQLQVGVILFALMEIVFVFFGGVLSDIVGRRTMAIVANLIFIIIVFPSILVRTLASYYIFMALYGISHGSGYTSEGDMISEIFPTNVRYTGNSFAYQFANAYIAGPAPYASVALGSLSVFLYPFYGLFFSVLAIISAIKFKETKDVAMGEAEAT